MTLEKFEDVFFEAMKDSFEPEGTCVTRSTVNKNNETLPCYVLNRERSHVGITIYPRDYFGKWENGVSMDELLFEVKHNILTQKIPEFDFYSLDRDGAESHLVSCVVGYDKNKEWLKTTPHMRIEDMAVYARWEIRDDASFVVNDDVLGRIKMTKEEMLEMAQKNRKQTAFFRPMEDVLFHLVEPEEMYQTFNGTFDHENIVASPYGLYVLGSSKPTHGAAVAMDSDVLKAVQKCLEDEFYLLPSSIHEALIVPKSTWEHGVDALKDMVRSVNAEDVPLQDQLTDSVYIFDGRSLKMAGVSEKMTVGTSMEGHKHRR